MKRHAGVALAFALFLVAVSARQADARTPRQAALPDLTISAISAPSSTSPGKTIVVSSSIRNQGRVTSVAFSLSYYLSTTTSKTSNSLLLGVQNVGSLSAGTSVTIVTSLAIPSTTSVGTFYVVGLADSKAVVSESKETNNSSSSGAISVKDSTPPTISAVTSSGVTASSATITWNTDEPSSSQVQYGVTTAYGSLTALATSLVTNHNVTLSGLTAGSVYHFLVHSKDSAGNAAFSGDLTFLCGLSYLVPTTPVTMTGESVSYYQGIYDNEYQSNKASLDSMAANGWGETYYYFQYALGGTLSMYEATKDTKYLERALVWAETMLSKATIIDRDGKRNWSGPDPTYSTTPTSHQLWDLQGSTELARLARIILTTPTLTSAYGSRATTIYNFVRDHIVNKWLFTRGTLFWFEDQQSTQTTKYFNDKVVLLIRILVHLKAASAALGGADNATFGYPSILLNMANGFLDRRGGSPRFEAYQGGLIWDKGLGWNGPIPPNDPSTALDTSHANRYPYAMVDLYKAGIVFTLPHLLGVATLLTKVMWNQSLTSPAFTNQLNGDNVVVDGFPPWFLGNIYHGWVVLAEYDPQVLRVADAMLKAVLAGVRNLSLDVTNTMDGRMALSGHLAKAVAR